MKVFLDTNIFMEYVSCRSDYKYVSFIFDSIEDGKNSAVASVGGIYTITYLLGRIFKQNDIHQPELNEKIRFSLNRLLELSSAVDCTSETVHTAINDEQFTDIEDSFQYHCALQHHCDVLLTINIKDYKNALDSELEVMTPQEFVEKYLK